MYEKYLVHVSWNYNTKSKVTMDKMSVQINWQNRGFLASLPMMTFNCEEEAPSCSPQHPLRPSFTRNRTQLSSHIHCGRNKILHISGSQATGTAKKPHDSVTANKM